MIEAKEKHHMGHRELCIMASLLILSGCCADRQASRASSDAPRQVPEHEIAEIIGLFTIAHLDVAASRRLREIVGEDAVPVYDAEGEGFSPLDVENQPVSMLRLLCQTEEGLYEYGFEFTCQAGSRKMIDRCYVWRMSEQGGPLQQIFLRNRQAVLGSTTNGSEFTSRQMNR